MEYLNIQIEILIQGCTAKNCRETEPSRKLHTKYRATLVYWAIAAI